MSPAARLLPLLTLQIMTDRMSIEEARAILLAKCEHERERTRQSHRKAALLAKRKRIDAELEEMECAKRS